MGNWSPYSKEWERQRIKKMIEQGDEARKKFEKKPWFYKAFVRLLGTIRYYWSLLTIHSHMLVDRKYRETMKQRTADIEEKTIKAIANIVKEERKN